MELPNLKAEIENAKKEVRQIASARIGNSEALVLGHRIGVADERGVLYSVPFGDVISVRD